jgi:hypothetical protein
MKYRVKTYQTIAALLSVFLILLSSPISAFGAFNGISQELRDDLNQGISYYDAEESCAGTTSFGNGESVTIIGDSITVGAQNAIKAKLPQAKIYAKSSKQFGGTDSANPTGLDIVKDSNTELRDYVVVALGTNGSASDSQIAELVSAIGDKKILFVNNYHYGDLTVYESNNKNFAEEADKQTSVSVADWATAAHADYAKYIDNSDGLGVHPTTEGKTLFAETIYNGLSSMISTVTSSEGVPTQTNGSAVTVDETGQYYQAAYNFLKDSDLSKNIYMKFKSYGLDDLHTAAVIGNWYAEGMNPAYTPIYICNGYKCGGYGLAQWGGGRSSGSPADGTDRDGGLYRYAISKGEPGLGASWETQVEYAWAEMTNKGPAASFATSQYNHQTFLSKSTLDDAAEYFQTAYERGIGTEKRQDGAQAAYKLFYGLGGSTCDSNTAGNGDIAAAAIKLSSGDWEGGCYLYGGGHGGYDDLMSRIEAKFRPLSSKGVDCSGFVMAAISYAAGKYVSVVTSTTNPGGNWVKITTPEPGAISTSSGHVEIITKVEGGKITETVGSHSTGCGQGKGPSVSSWGPFDRGNYFKYTGATTANN